MMEDHAKLLADLTAAVSSMNAKVNDIHRAVFDLHTRKPVIERSVEFRRAEVGDLRTRVIDITKPTSTPDSSATSGASPIVPDTNLGVTIDVTAMATPTPTRCSMEGPSRDAAKLTPAFIPAAAPTPLTKWYVIVSPEADQIEVLSIVNTDGDDPGEDRQPPWPPPQIFTISANGPRGTICAAPESHIPQLVGNFSNAPTCSIFSELNRTTRTWYFNDEISSVKHWCSDIQEVQRVSVFLDNSSGSGSCVTGILIQIVDACSVLSVLSSYSAHVLMGNILEDGNMYMVRVKLLPYFTGDLLCKWIATGYQGGSVNCYLVRASVQEKHLFYSADGQVYHMMLQSKGAEMHQLITQPGKYLPSSRSTPVLLTENYLEEGNRVKRKEGMQCLFGEILVEVAVWQNASVCCFRRICDEEEKLIGTTVGRACYLSWISEHEEKISYVVVVMEYYESKLRSGHQRKELPGIDVVAWGDLGVLIYFSWCALETWSSLVLLSYIYWLLVGTRIHSKADVPCLNVMMGTTRLLYAWKYVWSEADQLLVRFWYTFALPRVHCINTFSWWSPFLKLGAAILWDYIDIAVQLSVAYRLSLVEESTVVAQREYLLVLINEDIYQLHLQLGCLELSWLESPNGVPWALPCFCEPWRSWCSVQRFSVLAEYRATCAHGVLPWDVSIIHQPCFYVTIIKSTTAQEHVYMGVEVLDLQLLGWFDKVPASYDFYLHEAYYFDIVFNDLVYYREDYRNSNKMKSVHAPWDPGKSALRYPPKASAWGQAEFQEGRNVMTLAWCTSSWASVTGHGQWARPNGLPGASTATYTLQESNERASRRMTKRTGGSLPCIPCFSIP